MDKENTVGGGCIIGALLLCLIGLGLGFMLYGTIIWAIIHVVHKFF